MCSAIRDPSEPDEIMLWSAFVSFWPQGEPGFCFWIDGIESWDDPKAVGWPAGSEAFLSCRKAFSKHCGLAVTSEKSRWLSEIETQPRRQQNRHLRRPRERGTRS